MNQLPLFNQIYGQEAAVQKSKKKSKKRDAKQFYVMVYLPPRRMYLWFMTNAKSKAGAVNNALTTLVFKIYGDQQKHRIGFLRKKMVVDFKPSVLVNDEIPADKWASSNDLRYHEIPPNLAPPKLPESF